MKHFKFISIPKTATTYIEVNFGGPQFMNQFYTEWKYINPKKVKFIYENSIADIEFVGHSWSYPTKIGGWYDWMYPKREQFQPQCMEIFELRKGDTIFTVVRNPFDILYSMFNYNWGYCRKYHNFNTDIYTTDDFKKFVDIYLDWNQSFFAPAFRTGMFSQLKDKQENWLIDKNSVILRFENFEEDLENFRKKTNLKITDNGRCKNVARNTKPWPWWAVYRPDQVQRLKELWKVDLEYFDYSYENPNKKSFVVSEKKKKPKIALCFSGNLRDLNETKEFWTSLIQKYDIDVYGSFWDTENVELNDTIDNFKEIYNPKLVEVENYTVFKETTQDLASLQIESPNVIDEFFRGTSKSFGQLSMYYKVWRCNLLSKQSGEKYDLVIRARTDSKLDNNFEIIDNDMLNIPAGVGSCWAFPDSFGLNDCIAYAKPKIMDYYSFIYLQMMEYLHKGHYLFPPEHFLKVHFSKVDVKIRFFPNYITLTRKSKGTEDEIMNGYLNPIHESIENSNIAIGSPLEEYSFVNKKFKENFDSWLKSS